MPDTDKRLRALEEILAQAKGSPFRIHYQRPGEPGPTEADLMDPNLIWVEFVRDMPATAPIRVTKYDETGAVESETEVPCDDDWGEDVY